jgi:phenylacetate-CoA ligase
MTVGHGRFPLSAGGAPGAYRVLATSGTSGNKIYVAFDQGEWSRTADWLEQVGQRVGLTAKDVLLNTHCYGLWVGGSALDLLANRIGAGLVPLGSTDQVNVLEQLTAGVGTAISATPSYLRGLVMAANASHTELRNTRLRIGFIGAEMAEESLRQKLLAELPDGFRWIELYGLTETGGPSVAFAPDPAVPELEVNTREFWVEVLELSEDQPVKFGKVGELTITTRRTDGRTPLIRYRTRDLVSATSGGAEAPTRISRILGRVDESLKIGGVLTYPSAVAEIMSEFLSPTAEWRAWVLHQEPDDELMIEVEATPDLCSAIATAVQYRVGLNPTVVSTQNGILLTERRKTRRLLANSSTAPTAKYNVKA